ncbi:hypothetical protein ACMFMG_003731 [Clarireedia jacksonii]
MSCSEILALPAEDIAKILPTTATQSGMLTNISLPKTSRQTLRRTRMQWHTCFIPLAPLIIPKVSSSAASEYICKNAPATRELGGSGKYLGLASRAFDVHVGEVFLAWRHGLSLVTGKKSMLLDDLPLALQELNVTHASFVPSLPGQVGLVPSDVSLLRYMGVGGEKIS